MMSIAGISWTSYHASNLHPFFLHVFPLLDFFLNYDFSLQNLTITVREVYYACVNTCPYTSSVWNLKLLVYETLSY